MTTTTGPFERLTRQILALDYGDEQERLRYYETYAVAVHVQLIALPAVAAVVIAASDRSALGPVLIVLGTAFAAVLAGLGHLGRHHVRTEAIALRRGNRGFMAAYVLSCVALTAAVVTRTGGTGFGGGLGIGAGVGIGLALAAAALAFRRQRDDDAAAPES